MVGVNTERCIGEALLMIGKNSNLDNQLAAAVAILTDIQDDRLDSLPTA